MFKARALLVFSQSIYPWRFTSLSSPCSPTEQPSMIKLKDQHAC